MADVGLQKNFVDTQGVNLRNVTDNETYIQLENLNFDIKREVTKHELTDNTIHNVYSLYMNGIEGNLTLTNPQWEDLVTMTTQTAGILPIKDWEIKWIDGALTSKTTTFKGEMAILKPVDIGISVVKVFFRIECTESVVIA